VVDDPFAPPAISASPPASRHIGGDRWVSRLAELCQTARFSAAAHCAASSYSAADS
jgi:hypothetical protein